MNCTDKGSIESDICCEELGIRTVSFQFKTGITRNGFNVNTGFLRKKQPWLFPKSIQLEKVELPCPLENMF